MGIGEVKMFSKIHGTDKPNSDIELRRRNFYFKRAHCDKINYLAVSKAHDHCLDDTIKVIKIARDNAQTSSAAMQSEIKDTLGIFSRVRL